MKLCPTCGLEHPDHVQTSHHPNGCTCGSYTLHAPDGNNQGQRGCVWSQSIGPDENKGEAYLRLINARHEADQKCVEKNANKPISRS